MAHFFQPTVTRVVPSSAEVFERDGKRYARFKLPRGKKPITAPLNASGRAVIHSPTWWGEWTDASGKRHRVKLSTSKELAQIKLAELLRREQRIDAGIHDATEADTEKMLSEWLGEYADHLAAKGDTSHHVRTVTTRIRKLIDGLGWCWPTDLHAERLHRHLAELRTGPRFGVTTSNHHLNAMRRFSSWLANRRKVFDPLAECKPLDGEADRRKTRRALTADELDRLIETTRRSERTSYGLSGPDRAMLYLTAAGTGFRVKELASLTPDRLRLDDTPSSIHLEGKRSKRRRAEIQPLPSSLVALLREWVADRPKAEPLWPGSWHRTHAVRMLRKDLADASIPHIDTLGRVFDFHSFRVQFVVGLFRAGVPLPVAQKLARHSTPMLTSNIYGKLDLGELADAVDLLG